MKSHEALIRLLISEGVETVFTLMSEDTMGMMSTIEDDWDDDIDLVKTRHEQGAIAMADGHARSGDDVGVCLVGRGPAVAQTGTALVTARKKGSRVLLIVPETPLSDEYDVKEFEQESYLRSTVGDVVSIRSQETLIPDFKEAFHRVKVGNGPLAVQIPWDILDGEFDAPDGFETDGPEERVQTESAGARIQPDEALIQEAVDLYIDSDAFQPPVIIAGRGAIQSEAKEAIEELAERTGALLATSLQGRGYFSDHPYYLGFSGSWGTNITNKYLNEADIVFAVGIGLNPYTMDKGRVLGDDTKVVHIDTDPTNIGRYTPVDIGIEGDAKATVEAISRELEALGIHREGELWTEKLRTEIAEASTMNEMEFPDHPETMDPRELVVELNDLLPEDRVVATDAGHFTRWVMDGIEADPRDFVFSLDFASIGLGVPMGIGAARANEGRPCITVSGDAGFMMSIQEIETAVRNEIPMTIIVMNDSSLGSEYHSLDKRGYNPDTALVSTPDFAAIAEGIGAEGYTARSLEEVHELSEVLGRNPETVAVIDCKINHEVRHRSKM